MFKPPSLSMMILSLSMSLSVPVSHSLELVFVPIVSSEVMHNQLSPIAAELNKHYPGSFMSVPDTVEDYFAHHEKIDLTYCDESQASYLVHQHGFIPLLTTNEIIKATFVSQKHYSFEDINSTPNLTFAVNERDLLVTGSALEIINHASRLRFFGSNTNMLITLLKNENMVGIAPEEDIALLPNKLKGKLFIIRQEPLSPIYLLLNPKHTKKSKKITQILSDFHRLWDRSQTKFTYLNYYTLRPTTLEEKKSLASKALFEKYQRVIEEINKAQQ